MLDKVKVKILDPRLNNEFSFMKRGSPGSAGLDLVCCIEKTVPILAGEVLKIPTGIAIHVADPNYVAYALPRSGMGAKEGLLPAQAIATIDSDYQGQVWLYVWNRNKSETKFLNPGDRIAQLVFHKLEHPELVIVESFDEETVRGDGAFGSTGVR